VGVGTGGGDGSNGSGERTEGSVEHGDGGSVRGGGWEIVSKEFFFLSLEVSSGGSSLGHPPGGTSSVTKTKKGTNTLTLWVVVVN
jgi:hypothetical protein